MSNPDNQKGGQHPRRVLLVEDNTATRTTLERLLQMSGFEVKGVGDADTAIAELDRGGFDVLLTDLDLDGIDGCEVVAHAKSLSSIPITAVLTGAAHQETVGMLGRKGVDTVFRKPLEIDALIDWLEEAIKRRATGA